MIENITVGSRVDHVGYGEGIVSEVGFSNFKAIFVRGGERTFSKSNEDIEVLELLGEGESNGPSVDMNLVEEVVTSVLDKYGMLSEVVELGEKWEGGTLTLTPGKDGLQSKEIPIEAFFHKIVMLRDRLRVLEQNINSHSKLNDEEKVHLQQYITRSYGSLTTFNILFAEKDHYFKGTRKA